jgi:APA family basic amino acid/polyamine antiporter
MADGSKPSYLPFSVPHLKRQLGLLDATMINVGTIIASAIFLVPQEIALRLHATSLTVAVWIVGGIVSLLGALSIAELAAALPEAGGGFVYLTRAFGPVWGYLYGWANGTVINPASIAAIAVAFASYLTVFIPLGGVGIKAVAIASIVVLTAINSLGVRAGALTQNIFTLLKMGVLAALIVIGFALPGGGAGNLAPLWPTGSWSSIVGPFGLAMLAVLWAYDGWIESTYVGGEVTAPGRNLPRSIVYSTLIAVALYVLVTVSFTYVLSPARMAESPLVARDAAEVTLGRVGVGLVAGAILISTLGANNGIVLTAARIPYAMAHDGLMFRWIGGVHPRFLTPVPSLLVQGVISCLLALSGTYDQLFTYVIFTEFLFYAAMCAAVIRLRRRAPELPRPYRAWGYPFTPLAFIAFAIWLVYNTVIEKPIDSLVGAAILAAGLPLYFYWKGSAVSHQPSAETTPGPTDG